MARKPRKDAPPESATADEGFFQGLGRAVQVLRTELGLGRKDLAERAGLSYSYLSEIENGAKQPSSKALILLAKALGLDVYELIAAAEARMQAAVEASPSEAYDADAYRSTTRQTLRSSGYPIAPQASIRDWFHSDSRRSSPLEEQPLGLPDEPMGEPGPPERDPLEELEELLADLSEGDRERVLDLARRLSRK